MASMSTWLSRVASRLAVLVDPENGPWNPPSVEWADVDADVRRLRSDLDAIRVRLPERG